MELDGLKIVENIEKYGNANGDPSAQKEPVAEPTQDPKAEPAPTGFSFKTQDDLFKHKLKYKTDNKEVEEDIGTILKRAGQGYHYAQLIHRLNTEKASWEEKVKNADSLTEKWGRFENYAKENPAWYQHWEQAWANKGQNLAEPEVSDGNIDQKVNALLAEKLAPFQQMLKERDDEKLRAQLSKEDQELEQQVKSIREKYKDIDFEATDPESGKSLEYKVLEFGHKHGIKSFDTAFKAFYHDELVKREREAAKAEAAKETQQRTKAGFVEPGAAPTKSPQPSLQGLNWDQTAALAAKSLGIN